VKETILREILTFIQKGFNKLIKIDSKDIHNVSKKIIFQITAVLLDLYPQRILLQFLMIFLIRLKTFNIINIDNDKKYLLNTKSEY